MLAELAICLAACVVNVVVHEGAHAAVARACVRGVARISLGAVPLLLARRCGGTTIHIRAAMADPTDEQLDAVRRIVCHLRWPTRTRCAGSRSCSAAGLRRSCWSQTA